MGMCCTEVIDDDLKPPRLVEKRRVNPSLMSMDTDAEEPLIKGTTRPGMTFEKSVLSNRPKTAHPVQKGFGFGFQPKE